MGNKLTLEFDISNVHGERDAKLALKGKEAHIALGSIANDIFRPARKHGYSDPQLRELMKTTENAEELVSLLETKFYSILEDNDLNLDEVL